MTTHTHETAPTRFVEANGIRFVYRCFGKMGGVPFVMNIHYRGTMDPWDPAVTDGLAQGREVILFDNAGVGGSSGEVPTSFPAMATDAIAFIRALGIGKADVLGYSIGGKIAQEMAVQAPDLVRKLVLIGTGPRGADMSASRSAEIFAAQYDPPEHLWLAAHSPHSPAGRAARLAYLERKGRRRNRSPERLLDLLDDVEDPRPLWLPRVCTLLLAPDYLTLVVTKRSASVGSRICTTPTYDLF